MVWPMSWDGAVTGGNLTGMLGKGQVSVPLGAFREGTRRENGCEEGERAVTGANRDCPSPYHQKNQGVPLRDEEAFRGNVGPASASPQCQPTTHTRKSLSRVLSSFDCSFGRFQSCLSLAGDFALCD
jgi:hypothetical protein